jgi:elongation factor Ts
MAKVGENITIGRFMRYETAHALASYLHGSKIGVLVDYEGDASVARDIAMHIAASKPICVEESGISPEILAQERHIYEAQAAQSGKPAAILEKMVEGRMSKFLAEVTLLGQPFVKEPDMTVRALLAKHHTKIHRFCMLVVGACE